MPAGSVLSLIVPAQIDGVVALPLAWAIALLAIAIGALARRQLPAGASEGLFVAGVSAVLVLGCAVLGDAADIGFQLSASLIGLAVFWLAVVTWVERPETPAATAADPHASRRDIRRALGTHVAAVAALLGVGVATGSPAAGVATRVLVLVVLLLVAMSFHLRKRSELGRIAMVSVGVGWLTWPWLPLLDEPATGRLAVGVLLASVASLAIVIAHVLFNWRRRIARWRSDPQSLADPQPRPERFVSLVAIGAVVIGVVSIGPVTHWLTPVALFLTSLACLGAGHLVRSNRIGTLGLALVGEFIVGAAIAWLPASNANPLLGTALAGVYLLWLSRFWDQQLHDGSPWTTAGRLIPAARRLSVVCAGGELVAVSWWITLDPTPAAAGWQIYAAALLALLHALMLLRTGTHRGDGTLLLAGCAALVAALLPVRQIGSAHGAVLAEPLLLAAAAIVLVARTLRARGGEIGWPVNAYVAGLLPVVAACWLSLHPATASHWLIALLTGAGFVGAILLRWRLGGGGNGAR